jgi:hypothetical protein
MIGGGSRGPRKKARRSLRCATTPKDYGALKARVKSGPRLAVLPARINLAETVDVSSRRECPVPGSPTLGCRLEKGRCLAHARGTNSSLT